MAHNETTFHERFLAIRGWIEHRADETGTVQTPQLVVVDDEGGTRARGSASRSGRPGSGSRVERRVRVARQLALNLGGAAA